jgi:hypothetical protein
LAEIISCSEADRLKQLTFPNELGELPTSMRWEVQEGAILENNSVDVTVRIPSDCSDGTRDAQRLERTKRPGRSGEVGLISRIARSVAGFAITWPLSDFSASRWPLARTRSLGLISYEFPREMWRELDHSAVVQQQTINFTLWIEEILGNRAFYLRLGKAPFSGRSGLILNSSLFSVSCFWGRSPGPVNRAGMMAQLN